MWYHQFTLAEHARMQGEVGQKAAALVGQDFVERNIKIWSLMIPVLASGEPCPTHLRATRAWA